jgi:hypothetical protein
MRRSFFFLNSFLRLPAAAAGFAGTADASGAAFCSLATFHSRLFFLLYLKLKTEN